MNLRQIPNMNTLIAKVQSNQRYSLLSKQLIKNIISDVLKRTRKEILEKEIEKIDEETLMKDIFDAIDQIFNYQIKKCINATGTIIHTNLGRSNLPKEVISHLALTNDYNSLELDLKNGKRGNRNQHFTDIIKQLTNAEDCLIVNNNAAAVFLVLSTFAKNQEVIISRGELVEIGGSFRIPDIILQADCKMVEIGTTNRTHLDDYINHINENTKMLLKVHTSNFKIVGYTSDVSIKELCTIKEKHSDVIVYEDLASGALIDLSQFNLPKEPLVQDSIASGADIVSFSADKLLGSCQAGIIVGKKQLIDQIKKHPLNRCLRCSSLTLIALEATLKNYLEPQLAIKRIPTLQMISMTMERKLELAKKIGFNLFKAQIKHEIIECYATIGGGTNPESKIPSHAVIIPTFKVQKVAEYLLKQEVPIITRIEQDCILLDVTTIKEEDIPYITNAIIRYYTNNQ